MSGWARISLSVRESLDGNPKRERGRIAVGSSITFARCHTTWSPTKRLPETPTIRDSSSLTLRVGMCRRKKSEQSQNRFSPLPCPSRPYKFGSEGSIWILVLLLLVGNTFADAPKVTHLFPAGMQRGSTTTITCKGEFEWPVQVWASAGDVKLEEEKGELSISVPDRIATDRIWLRFYNEDGATSPMPVLLGNLPEVTEKEPNNSPTTAQKLGDFAKPPNDARVTINGVLDKKEDVDAFAIELKAGQTLVAAIEGNSHFGSPLDSILQVVSPTGIVLDENHDDVGLDPRLAFTCRESGTHIVRVFAFPAKPNQSIQFHGGADYVYRVTLTTGPYILRTIPSAVSVRNFGVMSPATVSVRGWNLDGDVSIPVRRFRGETESAFGFVGASGWASSSRVPLLMQPVLHRDGSNVVQRLPLPSSIDGCVNSDLKSESFRVALEKNEAIEIQVHALLLDSHLVPQMTITDPKHKSAYTTPESGPAKDIRHTFKAKETGEHTLTIQDRYGSHSERHYYRLTVKRPRRDFELSLDVDSIVVVAGEPTELPVTISRRNIEGDSVGEIRVSIEGLPDGVTCEPVVSKPDGESAKKITLKLSTESGEPFSGLVRVTGKELASGVRKSALTPERFRSRFNSLWLTAKEAKDEKSESDPAKSSNEP